MGVGTRPEQPKFTERNKIIKKLIAGAKKLGYPKVLLILSELYAKGETKDSKVFLANLHIEGIEFEKNVEKGISILEDAMNGGSTGPCRAFFRRLGSVFLKGLTAAFSPSAALWEQGTLILFPSLPL